MCPEIIYYRPREWSKSETNATWYHFYAESKNELIFKTETNSHRKQAFFYQRENGKMIN